jgi:IrrE N-terminal-like domain
MISWGDAHTRAAVMAAELQADLDIPFDRPVDVFGAIKQLGLVLGFAPLGNVSGLYLPERPPGILLHEGHPRTRQRYTAGHELGHHAFKHATEIDGDLETELTRTDLSVWTDHEKEAEAFGAWMLMPRRLVRHGLSELGIDRPRDPLDVYALSLWLGTSYTATARQLAVVRLATSHEAEAWARVPPRTVKHTLAGSMVPDDLHNDVWWLDARHNRNPIEARPGDRLVITLDEIPSSGYSWRFSELPEQVKVIADSYTDDWEPELQHPPEEHPELAGGTHPRSMLVEIDRGAGESIHRVGLVKDQEWESRPPSEEFELLISVNPPLSGIQVPEADLALTA